MSFGVVCFLNASPAANFASMFSLPQSASPLVGTLECSPGVAAKHGVRQVVLGTFFLSLTLGLVSELRFGDVLVSISLGDAGRLSSGISKPAKRACLAELGNCMVNMACSQEM